MDFPPLDENYISVATVPANIVPVSQPSEAIQRLLTKRQNGHNFVKNSLNLELEKINLEIEEEIRIEHDRLNENLEKLKQRIQEEETRVFDYKTNEQLISLKPEIWETVLPTVQWLNEQRLEQIENFYETLKSFEKKKLNKIKKIFQTNYKKMGEISYLAPFELLEFFETESLRINEISMSNHRHYSDLTSQLKLQITQEIRIFNMAYIETKEKYKLAIMQLNDTNTKKEDDIKETLVLPPISDSCSDNFKEVGLWTQQVHETLADLDSQAKKLIHLYKNAIFNVFNRLFDNMKTVSEGLQSDSFTNPSYDAFSDSEPYGDVTEIYNCELDDLQTLWTQIIDYMESDIKKTQNFLNSSAHLWDAHFKRDKYLKKLILEDLNLEISKNDKSSRIYDRKIIAVLDQLREGSNLTELEKKFKGANKILDSIQKLYVKQCDHEIKVLDKFKKMTDQSIELLISEIDYFLNENVKNDSQNNNLYCESDDRIPYQMKICQYQVDAVNNWMFGLWESIKNYMQNCHKEMSNKADLWIEQITVKIKKRLDFKSSTLNPRYHRVKLIFDSRLKEIEDHEKDFQKYEKTLLEYLENPVSSERVAKLEILEKFENSVAEINLKLQETVNSQQVNVCIEKVKVAALQTSRDLEENFKQTWQKIEENNIKADKLIRVWNHSIKLFIDGGNYNRDEAKFYKKKIQKITKTVPGKFKKIQDEFARDKNDILQKLEMSKKTNLERLELWKSEFENNEITCKKIKICQNSLRNYAYEMKFHIHRTESYIDDFDQEIHKLPYCSDAIKKSFRDCLEKLTLVTDFLTDEENGYLIRINRLIDETRKEIETIAKDFYSRHSTILNQQRVQPTLECFLDEVGKNFVGFQVQIKLHLWENLQELIDLAIRFVKIIDDGFFEAKKQFRKKKIVEDLLKKNDSKSVIGIESRIDAVKFFITQLLDFMKDKVFPEAEIK